MDILSSIIAAILGVQLGLYVGLNIIPQEAESTWKHGAVAVTEGRAKCIPAFDEWVCKEVKNE